MSSSNNNGTVKDFNASDLSDTDLATKAQEELNMEGEMEEVRYSFFPFFSCDSFFSSKLMSNLFFFPSFVHQRKFSFFTHD
jgi:hypothetical protein